MILKYYTGTQNIFDSPLAVKFLKNIPIFLIFVLCSINTYGADPSGPTVSLNLNGMNTPEDYSMAIQLVLFMTLLTLAPSIVMLMTSFTRIVIVLGFVRSALGIQQAPSNQIIVGLAFFLTLFLMGNVLDKVYIDAAQPYMDKKINSKEAFNIGTSHLKGFMLKQTRAKDLEFFLNLNGGSPSGNIPLNVAIPAFVLSELKTAFQMGFMVFIPFLIIDFLVASVLMAMGMMMMPPAIISLPFKLLLFVLVDGWYLVTRSIVESFSL